MWLFVSPRINYNRSLIRGIKLLGFNLVLATWLFSALSDILSWCLFPILNSVWKFRFGALELWVMFCMLYLNLSIMGFEVSFYEGRRLWRLHSLVNGGEFGVLQLWSNQVLQLRLWHFDFNRIWDIFVTAWENVDGRAWFLAFNEIHWDLNSAGEPWQQEVIKMRCWIMEIKPGKPFVPKSSQQSRSAPQQTHLLSTRTVTFLTLKFTHNPFIPMIGEI